MVFECYDTYGKIVHRTEAQVHNFEEVVIKVGNHYYRPIFFELNGAEIARCVPAKLVVSGEDNAQIPSEE